MKTTIVDRRPVTSIQADSKRKLKHLIRKLSPHTETPELGRWRELSNEELWARLVSQVCVMGSALPMEKLLKSGKQSAFEGALSLKTLTKVSAPSTYIETQLATFKATRFKKKAALRLSAALANPNIVSGRRVVLLDKLPQGNGNIVREELLLRTASLFKRKSVSDLMITVGISHDVIALDQRVVGLLNARLNYNRKFSYLQTNTAAYLSVEDCLRGVCEEAKISLGELDRMLFNFAGLSAAEYLMEYDLQHHARDL